MVRAWALAGDLDADAVTSNTFDDGVAAAVGPDPGVPGGRSGRVVRSGEAREKINPAQVALLDRLERAAARERSSDAISPTAHYTGQVWARNGLSHPRLGTREGRVLFEPCSR